MGCYNGFYSNVYSVTIILFYDEVTPMNHSAVHQIYAKALGDLVLSYLSAQGAPPLPAAVESRALDAIAAIQAVLDDKTLDDPHCFQRIEAIVEAFSAAGLSTSRHDWG